MPPRDLFLGVITPLEPTLAKYGLTEPIWQRMVEQETITLPDGTEQGVCWICRKLPPSARLVVDHEHARGWAKMEPGDRLKYVRGLLCHTCNHYILSRVATILKLRAGADYLERYIERKAA
jgi:hypothetical protein